MTAQEIADRVLVDPKMTPVRVAKLKALCARPYANVPLDDVLALLPADVVEQIKAKA
jgi:hypothetical protein